MRKAPFNRSRGASRAPCPIFKLLLPLLLLIFLQACEDGGSNNAPNEAISRDSTSGLSLKIELYRQSSGEATTSIGASEPGEIIATFTRRGKPLASEIVQFQTNLGTLSISESGGQSGSALTDVEGKTRIRLSAAALTGAGTFTASAVASNSGTGTESISVKLNFAVIEADTNSTAGINVALSLSSPSMQPNTIRGDAPGELTALVTDTLGAPLENTVVQFSSAILSFDPATATALTDASGEARITVLANETTGIATITAAVEEGAARYQDMLNITVDPPAIQLGNGLGNTFIENVLALNTTPISAGGTSSVLVNVVNEDNTAFDSPLTVQFTSPCVESGKATIDLTVTTVNGAASATYRSINCVGTDRITASLDFGGSSFSAIADITIVDDTAGSIVFVETNPGTIVLRGAGGQNLVETSAVSFQVQGSQGGPLANQIVEFSLTSSVGGITYGPTMVTTDANGMVSTSVQSGNVATSVVVIATLPGLGISTQSGRLVISTGVPDQDSMTLSLETCNPEALDYDGVTVPVTVYSADHFNNPVPDGVQFSFTAEGGIIEPTCSSVNGSCTVNWVSQNPKPDDGHATIMVSAIGAESFDDENGNGVFDEGDLFEDQSEAYRDDSWTGAGNIGSRDPGEPYIDLNINGIFDLPDSLYGGSYCEHATLCADIQGSTVRAQRVMTLSGSNLIIDIDAPDPYTSGAPISVTISDVYGNTPPDDTVIELTLDNGELNGQASVSVAGCRREALTLNYTVTFDPASVEGDGVLSITTTTPQGVVEFEQVVLDY